MPVPRLGARVFCVSMIFLGTGAAYSQSYPNKPIRMLTGGVGGGNDVASRLIAPGLAENLGQQVIVDNRSNSVVPGQIVSQASPDGYTLLLYNNGLWTLPLMQSAPYDPVHGFSPISLVASAPNILVVHPSLAVKSVKELIALAKAKPGVLNYASSGAGASNHIAAELFKSMAGVDIVRINYKSGGAIYTDLFAGQVQIYFATAGSGSGHVKSGKLRALAVTSAKPSALLPGLPTLSASGLSGYDLASIQGLFAPARTTATVINRLNQELRRVLNRTDVKDRFFNNGVEVVGSSPQQLANSIKSEMDKLGKLIKDAGIQAD